MKKSSNRCSVNINEWKDSRGCSPNNSELNETLLVEIVLGVWEPLRRFPNFLPVSRRIYWNPQTGFHSSGLNALLAKRPCFLWHWIKPAGLDPKVPTQHKPVGCLDDKLPTFCSRTKNIGLAGDISLNNLTVRWHTGWLGRTRACMFLKCPTIHLEGRLTTGVVSKFVQVLRRSSASGPQGNRRGVKWHVLFI